jgi:AraC-like DNA-binding protein
MKDWCFCKTALRRTGIGGIFLAMAESSSQELKSVQTAWIGDVKEVFRPVSMLRPLWVRHDLIQEGEPLQPTAPYPEQHPYCELSFVFSGKNIQYVGTGQVERHAGDLLLLGPHTPHYAQFQEYPYRSVTVHFLPVVLCGMGLEGDGARLFARFTSPQDIRHRAVRLPAKMRKLMERRFQEMAQEVASPRIGCQLRLLALLIEALVELMRWEESTGQTPNLRSDFVDWPKVEKALRFIHEHYSENLYIEQIAKATGLSIGVMQSSFRNAMGVSCVRYIRAYRIARATALLGEPGARITEISLEVGFETLSHFNTSFRELTGMSPTEYIQSCRQAKTRKSEPPSKPLSKPKSKSRRPSARRRKSP